MVEGLGFNGENFDLGHDGVLIIPDVLDREEIAEWSVTPVGVLSQGRQDIGGYCI